MLLMKITRTVCVTGCHPTQGQLTKGLLKRSDCNVHWWWMSGKMSCRLGAAVWKSRDQWRFMSDDTVTGKFIPLHVLCTETAGPERSFILNSFD